MFRLTLAIAFVVAASAAEFHCGTGGPETDYPSTDGYNHCADNTVCPCGTCCYCSCEVGDADAPEDSGSDVDAPDAGEPAWVLGVSTDGVLYRCSSAIGTKFCRGNKDPQRNSFEVMNFPTDVSHWSAVDTGFEATVTGGKWTVDASKVLHFTGDDATDYEFQITTRDVRRVL